MNRGAGVNKLEACPLCKLLLHDSTVRASVDQEPASNLLRNRLAGLDESISMGRSDHEISLDNWAEALQCVGMVLEFEDKRLSVKFSLQLRLLRFRAPGSAGGQREALDSLEALAEE